MFPFSVESISKKEIAHFPLQAPCMQCINIHVSSLCLTDWQNDTLPFAFSSVIKALVHPKNTTRFLSHKYPLTYTIMMSTFKNAANFTTTLGGTEIKRKLYSFQSPVGLQYPCDKRSTVPEKKDVFKIHFCIKEVHFIQPL